MNFAEHRIQIWANRSAAKKVTRDFFERLGYLELDTPMLVPSPGVEIHLDYFSTPWRDYVGKSHTVYLRSSPELHMKQAVGMGFQQIFQLAPCFRNGGEAAAFHHPEFTMLEWYEVGLSMEGLMKQSADLVIHLAQWLSARPEYSGRATALGTMVSRLAKIPKLSVFDAFRELAGIELVDEDPDLAARARAANVLSVNANDDFETSFYKVLLEKIEPRLQAMAAVFLCDYPPSQAALARVINAKAQRFELYLDGVEICNAFDELSNGADNVERIKDAELRRAAAGKEPVPRDQGYMDALAKGLPQCCGNALGFERLLAVLMGETHLGNLIPFRYSGPWQPIVP